MAVFPYSVAAFLSVVVPCYSLVARVVRGGFRRLGVPFSFRSIVSPPCSPCCSPSCSPLFLYFILTSSTLIAIRPSSACTLVDHCIHPPSVSDHGLVAANIPVLHDAPRRLILHDRFDV